MLLAIQAGTVVAPTWVGPTVALSLVVIALAFVAIALVALLAARQVQDSSRILSEAVGRLEAEALPALRRLRKLAKDGRAMTKALRGEAESWADTSHTVRERVEAGTQRIEDHLVDLDTLYETVYDEVEDTAIGLAATLKTARGSTRLLRPLARWWRRRRR